MYLRHFAFTRFPFAANLEADELFASTARHEAEARLKHLLELRGIGLLTGEVGCGKTTVCRHVTAKLHPGLYRVFYVLRFLGLVALAHRRIADQGGPQVRGIGVAAAPGLRRVARLHPTATRIVRRREPRVGRGQMHRPRLVPPSVRQPGVLERFERPAGASRRTGGHRRGGEVLVGERSRQITLVVSFYVPKVDPAARRTEWSGKRGPAGTGGARAGADAGRVAWGGRGLLRPDRSWHGRNTGASVYWAA